MAGGGDKHVAVLQVHDGRAVARVGENVALGGDRHFLVRKFALVIEGVLKFQNAFGVALHFVQSGTSQSRLQVERPVVFFRPALFFEQGGDVFARIGRKNARARVDRRIRDEQGGGKQRQKDDDAEENGKQNERDASDHFHARSLLCRITFEVYSFFRGLSTERGENCVKNRRPPRAAEIWDDANLPTDGVYRADRYSVSVRRARTSPVSASSKRAVRSDPSVTAA